MTQPVYESGGYVPRPVPADKTGRDRIIVWHQRPDTNWRTSKDYHHHLNIKPWPEGKPFPDRGSAYACQVGMGSWRQTYGYGAKKWSIELESLGPMVYFGEPVRQEDGLYCKDDKGQLHGPLEEGESIEPTTPGEITVTHALGDKNAKDDW
jgi:hypothetical protein